MANERLARAISTYVAADRAQVVAQMGLAQRLAVQEFTDRGWTLCGREADGAVLLRHKGEISTGGEYDGPWEARIDLFGRVR